MSTNRYSERYSERRAVTLAGYARLHRFAPTASEARLWEALRGGRLGVRFRRQVVLGHYIADFFAAGAALVVEVDGGCHRTRRAPDARRDAWMRRQGYRVLRVSAEAVMQRLPAVVAAVEEALGSVA